MMDYTWRLAGVCEEVDALHWNVRPGHPAAQGARFRVRTDAGPVAEMEYDAHGAEISLGGKALARIDAGVARLITNMAGVPRELVGIGEQPQKVVLRLAGLESREVAVGANERIAL